MKKMISIIMSAMLAMSGASAMNGSALLIQATEGSEQYNSFIKGYNESRTPLPELVDDFNCIFPGSNVKNVWVSKNHGSTSQWSNYVIETEWQDTFGLGIEPQYRESILEEFSAKLGYEDKYEILGEQRITFRFYEDDHELNYMIAEKAYSLVKDKYIIKDISISLASRHFYDTSVQSCFLTVDGYGYYPDEKKYDELISKIYDSVDQEMLSEKFNARFTETGKIEFSEGFTETDKVKCFRYFAENYNTGIYAMTEAAEQSASAVKGDLTEINYLEGDANCDNICSIADAATVLQSLGNPDKYGMSRQGSFNADLAGDGLTTTDALAIQKKLAELS